MPSLSQHQSQQTLKALFIGDSGKGKTGALASLASAGYNLRILDLDNGLDVLVDLLSNPKSSYAASKALERVHYHTVTEPMRNINGKLVPAGAKMWPTAMGLLDDWKDDLDNKDSKSLGPITSWTPNEVLVVDSLSMLSTAAMNYILSLNGRLGQRPHQSDWGEGQALIEGLLQRLYSKQVACNVIINCHIKYIGNEGMEVGYPNTLGQALPPKVGSYFNTVLQARSTGVGAAERREIFTQSSAQVGLKNTAPLKVLPKYPLETGLADYFRAVLGKLPGDK